MTIAVADSANNKELGVENSSGPLGAARVVLYDSAGNALVTNNGALHPNKGVPIAGDNDGLARPVAVDPTGAISTALWTRVFHDALDGAAIATALWTQASTTYTLVQGTRVITLNSASSAAASANANITSTARFSRTGGAPLRLRQHFRAVWIAQSQIEIGFGVPSAATAIADGVYLRVQTTGTVQLVMAFNSTEIALDLGAFGTLFPDASRWFLLDLVLFDDRAELVVRPRNGANGAVPAPELAPVFSTVLQVPTAQAIDFNAVALPVFNRVFTAAGFSGAAPSLFVGPTTVMVGNTQIAIDQATQAALLSMTGHAVPAGAIGSTANYANSTPPASATLSNTTAGYSTLGGQWQFAALGGLETDYVLFGYVVPTGRRLIVRGMRVEAWVMGAASATTPTLLQWGIGRGTAASLVNNQYRAAIGSQSIAVGTAIGGQADRAVDAKIAPFIVESGQFVQVILRMPVGTATASQILRGVCTIDASFI